MSLQETGPILDSERVWQSECIGPSASKQSLGRTLAERLNKWQCQDALSSQSNQPQLILQLHTVSSLSDVSLLLLHTLLAVCSVWRLLVERVWKIGARFKGHFGVLS